MKSFFTLLLLFVGMAAYGQATVTLTEDLVLTETLVISEDTNYEGNGFRITCDGCSPMIKVTGGAKVHFQDVIFTRTFTKWMEIDGGNMTDVTWNSKRMNGYIRSNE